MYKKKGLLLLVLCGVLALTSTTLLVLKASSEETSENGKINLPSFYETTNYFPSNKYTSEETMKKVDNQYEITANDTKILSNAYGTYYVNKEDLSIKFEDISGYIHNTSVNQNDPDGNRLLNTTNYNIARSAVNVYYYDYKNNNMTMQTESMFTSNASELKAFTLLDNGFDATYFYGQSGIELTMNVRIDGNTFTIAIPDEKIIEHYASAEDKDYRLGALSVYSYFGGVNGDQIDGYNFVPDGVGALIRYKPVSETPYNDYTKAVYGSNRAKMTTSSLTQDTADIHMPVFGYVHGVNQHGMVANIAEGAEYASIIATQSGTRFPFYRVYPEFVYRCSYLQPMSSSGNSISLIQSDRDHFDIAIRYEFLKDENANYVGMANAYRKYLLENQLMTEKVRSYENIPLRVDTIGQEVTEGVFFNKKIQMTTFKESQEIIESLKEMNIENIVSVYKGYTNKGVTWSAPVYQKIDSSLGKIGNLDLTSSYFYMNPITASARQSGYNTSKDIAKKINTQLITDTIFNDSKYYLNPESTQKIALKNAEKLREKYGIENLAIDDLGSLLYSSYSGNKSSRSDAKVIYQETIDTLDQNVALYAANDYMFSRMDKNFDYSMFSSQYLAFDDTVPFTSIVMAKNIELYSTYVNFFSNARDDLLRMIDYQVYPSFLLTKEASSKLDETALNYIYASKYDDLKEAVNVYYHFVNDALKEVINATLIQREVVQDGVVINTYDNGKQIIINYLNEETIVAGSIVPSKSYLVIGGETYE